MKQKIRVAIDCRIGDPRQGIGTAVLALAKALSESVDVNQEYTFIVSKELESWLGPKIWGHCKLECIEKRRPSRARAILRRIRPVHQAWRRLRGQRQRIPVSDGFVESNSFDLVHFPTQTAYLTELPSIYQPWDLQHRHHPEFFTKDEIEKRDREYQAFCTQASYVCVQAEWTKRDVAKQLEIANEKIVVIPWGSVFDAYRTPTSNEIHSTVEKYHLPNQFFFYPAATWPHKNHEVIFRALSLLKSESRTISHVFFTGTSKAHYAGLTKLAEQLHVNDQVHFLGFVSSEELQSIYNVATAMIFPSKFEGFGLPILEAFHAGLPVLSSNATTLPEVGCDGALYFDPSDPRELANLMQSILNKPELRSDLINKGHKAFARFSMENTAKLFQELYDRTARSSRSGCL